MRSPNNFYQIDSFSFFRLCICSFNLFLIFLLSFNLSFAQNTPPWYIHFADKQGVHSSGISTSFISSGGSGMARVSANGGGSFLLQNPGLSNFGVDSELKGISSSTSIPSKFSVYDYSPGKTFYIKYTLRWDGSNNGEWYCFVGDGATYSNDNTYLDSEVFAGFRITYTNGGLITIGVREANSWASLPGANVGIRQNTTYTFEIFGNNSLGAINYKYGSDLTTCSTISVASGTLDVYMNGYLVGNDLTKGALPINSNIDSYMFYGVNNPGNNAVYYLDDITYNNVIPTSIIEPPFQPTQISFSDTTSTSMKVSFTPAHTKPMGYLILRKAGSEPSGIPLDNTNYTVGSVIGDGLVAYIGPNSSADQTGLNPETNYFYKIFAYNGAGNCRNYLTSAPLNGNQSTFISEDLASFRSIKDGNWKAAASWTFEYKPGRYKQATKFPTKNNKSITILQNHKISSEDIQTRKLEVQNGAILTVLGNLIIDNGPDDEDFINKGTVSITGNMVLSGNLVSHKKSKIDFNGLENQNVPAGKYQNLSVSSGGIKTLTGDIFISDQLQLNSASINTGEFIISMDSASTLTGETSEHYIKGKVKIIKSVASKSESFNGLNLTIDATTNRQNLGKVTVIRTTGIPNFVGKSSSIGRSWSIEPEFQPKKEVKLTLDWLAADEETPVDLNYMMVWKSKDKGNTWYEIGEYQPALNRSITVNTSSFSDWTVTDFNNVLPVSIKDFTATETKTGVSLKWESSNSKVETFEIEKSIDGFVFWNIGYLKNDNIYSPDTGYFFDDKSFISDAYYRIKETELNGSAHYSPSIFIQKKEPVRKLFSVYPNPVNNLTKLYINTSTKDIIRVDILTEKGKPTISFDGNLDHFNSKFSSYLNLLSPGVYFLNIQLKNQSEVLKIIKSY